MNCLKCDADISDTYEESDWSCGINAGWYCDNCDMAFGEHEFPREPLDDDVMIEPAPRDPAKPIGTPIDQISGRPGHDGYAEWVRISKSWGYD